MQLQSHTELGPRRWDAEQFNIGPPKLHQTQSFQISHHLVQL